ncbi:MAG: hypothetical protein ABW133_04450 [Polyangiaceae bacterium]
MARLGLQWGTFVGIGLAASCVLGPMGCASEDEPDTTPDAASDAPRSDARTDTSVNPDVSNDGNTVDQRDAGGPDVSADTSTDGRTDATPEGGNCVGGGDAARDGMAGMLAVQALNCVRCHQDEAADAGIFLSGKAMALATSDAGSLYGKNLTPDPVTGLGCWTDPQIANAILNGTNQNGQTLCTRMPRFNTRIDGGVAQEIVDFLRTLPPVNKAIPETTYCPPQAPVDAGSEAGTDGAAPDGGAPDSGDAGTDGTAPEAGPDGTTTDAGSDAQDAAADGATDSGSDAGTDTNGDAGTDSGSDADNDANG